MPKQLNEQELDLVKRFFDYDLSESELNAFENKLDNDSDFRTEVEKYKQASQVIDALVLQGDHPIPPPLENQNQNGGEAETEQQSSTTNSKRGWMRILLPILLGIGLAVIGYFSMKGEDKPPVERVYAESNTYVKSMTHDIMRGDDVEPDPTIKMSLEQIELKRIIDAHDKERKDITTALETFIPTMKELDTKELAEWWLANEFLEKGNMEKAKKALQSIISNSDYNSSKKAKSILEQL